MIPIIGHKLEPDGKGLVYKSVIPYFSQYPDIDLDEMISNLERQTTIYKKGYLNGKLVEVTASYKDKIIVEVKEGK